MKRLFLGGVFGLFLLSGCLTNENGSREEQYRTVDMVRELSPEQFGNKKARAVAVDGDSLFVVATDSLNKSSLTVFQKSTGQKLGTVESWTTPSGTETFNGSANCVTVSSDKIFVGVHESRIEVFNRATLAWITTIGTGYWWGDDSTKMVHSFGLNVMDSLLVLRDKMGLRFYTLSSITAEKRFKIPFFAKSIDLSEETYHHGIGFDKSRLYVTDGWYQRIFVFNRSDIREDSAKITPIDTIPLSYHPLGLMVHNNQLFVTGENGIFECRSMPEGDLIKRYSALSNYTYSWPGSSSSQGNSFCVVEERKGSVIQGEFTYGTVTIYGGSDL